MKIAIDEDSRKLLGKKSLATPVLIRKLFHEGALNNHYIPEYKAAFKLLGTFIHEIFQ